MAEIDFSGRKLQAEVTGPAGTRLTSDDVSFDVQWPATGPGRPLVLTIQFPPGETEHVWIPHVAPENDFVVGDHAFRSPAIIRADSHHAVALVPDLDDVADVQRQGRQAWLDYDHPQALARFAVGSYEVSGHVLFHALDDEPGGPPVRLRIHVLCSDDPADVDNPYGLAARFLWERWGRPGLHAGGAQRLTFDRAVDHVVHFAFGDTGWAPLVWQRFEIDGRPASGPPLVVDQGQHPDAPPDQRRWRERKAIWNQAWFSTQRVANGLLRTGQARGDDDLCEEARRATAVALAAPRTDGLFPSVLTCGDPKRPAWQVPEHEAASWPEAVWTNSDRRPWGSATPDAVHLVDAAITALNLLEWADLTNDETPVELAVGLADRLVELQLPSGAFPGWVEADGGLVPELLEGPESAASVSLLLQVARRFPGQTDCLAAAERGLRFLAEGPVATGAWEDFETWYSCCAWGRDSLMGKRIERNGVHKQNNLAIAWCAEAFLEGWRTSGRPDLLALGRRCLDELCLYQAVWDPPALPAPGHGGFGVMNADAEWNDARQGVFAPPLCAYGAETGVSAYFERGVAAARAAFTMLFCPENEAVYEQYRLAHPRFGPESYGFMMENVAHMGPAQADGSAIGPFTIFTWGPGTALAAAAKLKQLYGDVYVDVERGWAVGVDGCDATLDGVQLSVYERFGRSHVNAVSSTGDRTSVPINDDGVGTVNVA